MAITATVTIPLAVYAQASKEASSNRSEKAPPACGISAVKVSIGTLRASHAYTALWEAACENNADIRFVKSKMFSDDEKGEFSRWLELLKGPLKGPNYADAAASIAYESKRSTTKFIRLNQAERIALFQMLMEVRMRLDQACEKYISSDEKQSKEGRETLVNLAGGEAVKRLDEAVDLKERHPPYR